MRGLHSGRIPDPSPRTFPDQFSNGRGACPTGNGSTSGSSGWSNSWSRGTASSSRRCSWRRWRKRSASCSRRRCGPDYHHRFTGLSEDPFARGEVPIPYPEHRLRLLGPVFAWALGLRGLVGTYVPVAFNVPLLMLFMIVVRTAGDAPPGGRLHAPDGDHARHDDEPAPARLPRLDGLLLRDGGDGLPVANGWPASSFFLALFGDPRVALMIPMMGIWTLMDPGSGRPLAASARRVAVLVASSPRSSWPRMPSCGHSSTRRDRPGRSIAIWRWNSSTRWTRCISTSAPFMTFKAGWLLALMPMWFWLARRPGWWRSSPRTC